MFLKKMDLFTFVDLKIKLIVFFFPLKWLLKALMLKQKGNLMELVDPTLALESNFEKEVLRVIEVTLLYTNPSPRLRPMTVVSMPKG